MLLDGRERPPGVGVGEGERVTLLEGPGSPFIHPEGGNPLKAEPSWVKVS